MGETDWKEIFDIIIIYPERYTSDNKQNLFG